MPSQSQTTLHCIAHIFTVDNNIIGIFIENINYYSIFIIYIIGIVHKSIQHTLTTFQLLKRLDSNVGQLAKHI